MKILIIHNFYQNRGGEDTVFYNECSLLKSHGIEVETFTLSNNLLNNIFYKIFFSIQVPLSVFSFFLSIYLSLKHKPDIVHVHNYFPLFSPSIFWGFKMFGIKTVLTLHNFRMICPSGTFFINKKINLNSLYKGPLHTLSRKVYKQSFIATFLLIIMIILNKKIKTWSSKVDCFISLTEFQKDLYLKFGLPKNKIIVKNNSLPPSHNIFKQDSNYAVFVGRGSEEKGLSFLLNVWKKIPFKLVVIGSISNDKIKVKNTNNIKFMGSLSHERTQEYIRKSKFLAFPSLWFEGFPMVLIEAMRAGIPSIVNDCGSMPSIIKNNHTGIVVETKNKLEWTNSIIRLINDDDFYINLSKNCDKYFLKHYTDKRNCKVLISTYKRIFESKSC